MKSKHSTAFDITMTFITKILFLGGSLITSILLARLLGPQGKGTITALFVIPNTMISLADLGVRQASAYLIGKQKYTVQEILSSSLFLWIITSVLAVIVVSIYYLIPFTETYSIILMFIGVSYVPAKILVSYFNGIFQGQQLINRMNMKTILEFAAKLILVIILVWMFDMGVIGGALATALPTFVVLLYSSKMISKTAKIKIKYHDGIPQEMFRKGIAYAIALFVLQLNYKVDLIFLENMVSASELGIYSVGVTLAELIWQVPAAISVVLFARSANSKTNKEASNRSAKLLRISWIPLLLISSILFIGAPLIVRILYGEEYILAGNVIRIFLPGIVLMVLFKTLNADLAGRGKPLFALKTFSITLLTNILLNFILIPRYNMYGAAIGSTISYMIGALLFSVEYHRYTGIPYRLLFIITKEDLEMIKHNFLKLKNRKGRKQ